MGRLSIWLICKGRSKGRPTQCVNNVKNCSIFAENDERFYSDNADGNDNGKGSCPDTTRTQKTCG